MSWVFCSKRSTDAGSHLDDAHERTIVEPVGTNVARWPEECEWRIKDLMLSGVGGEVSDVGTALRKRLCLQSEEHAILAGRVAQRNLWIDMGARSVPPFWRNSSGRCALRIPRQSTRRSIAPDFVDASMARSLPTPSLKNATVAASGCGLSRMFLSVVPQWVVDALVACC